MAKVGFPHAVECFSINKTHSLRVSCFSEPTVFFSVGDAMGPATGAAPLRFCSPWPSRTAGTSPPTVSCWGSCLLSSAPTLTKLYVTYCWPQINNTEKHRPVTVSQNQACFLLMHFRCPAAASFWLHRQGGGGETLASRPWYTCANCWLQLCELGEWRILWVQWQWFFREDLGQLFLLVYTVLSGTGKALPKIILGAKS